MHDYEACRPYVEHLRAEHRRLHGPFASVRSALSKYGEVENAGAFASAAELLTGLREELKHHFSEEEQGGCLDEAVSLCPRLSGEEKRIEAEHPQILAQIDRLLEQLRAPRATPENWSALQTDLDDLFRAIQRHETAENRLLLEAFGISANGYEPVREAAQLPADDD